MYAPDHQIVACPCRALRQDEVMDRLVSSFGKMHFCLDAMTRQTASGGLGLSDHRLPPDRIDLDFSRQGKKRDTRLHRRNRGNLAVPGKRHPAQKLQAPRVLGRDDDGNT